MEILTYNDFKPMEGDAFEMVAQDGATYEAVLTTVKATKVFDYPGKVRDPFSLFFDGTKGTHCPQGTFRIRHPSGFEQEIFLVPIAGNPDGTFKYQAVFN